MRSTISIKAVTKDGKPMSARLGDVFIMKSNFVAVESDIDISNYIILSLLTVAISPAPPSPSKIYFSMLGMDSLRYSVSKRTENGLIILDRGKEIELDEKYIIKAIKALSGSRGSGIVGGLELYIRTITTTPSRIKKMDMRKLPIRLVDLSKWPRMSLRQWAIHHLGLNDVPTVNYINNRTNMINCMIKLLVSARRPSNSGGIVRDTSIRGIPTGRIRNRIQARSNPGRFGRMRGVPFINLNLDEIKLPQAPGDRIRAHPYLDISKHNTFPYMIICVDGEPMWMSVQIQYSPQYDISWVFSEGDTYNMPVRPFNDNILEQIKEREYALPKVEMSDKKYVMDFLQPDYEYCSDTNTEWIQINNPMIR